MTRKQTFGEYKGQLHRELRIPDLDCEWIAFPLLQF